MESNVVTRINLPYQARDLYLKSDFSHPKSKREKKKDKIRRCLLHHARNQLVERARKMQLPRQ